ncbi:MAG: PEP-CTERM sorting domain-containing protein [Bryobacterales bacterium]|nr:PEP-CTERM sorting domain-containing protein [Bryobacterales bacterium]
MNRYYLLLAGFLSATATFAATFYGPTPYLSASNSPFTGTSFSYFHLEDFEDGSLNTPGVTANTGIVLGPSINTDSVDGDDGAIDGLGQNGHSWFSNASTNSFTFTFSAAVLGNLPTHAGIVWTDMGATGSGPFGFGSIALDAYDGNGNWLGGLGPGLSGDNSVAGGTSEDRFFGVFSATGIGRIVITVDSNDWEVDHLQYGFADSVPEPSTIALASFSLLAFAVRRFITK